MTATSTTYVRLRRAHRESCGSEGGEAAFFATDPRLRDQVRPQMKRPADNKSNDRTVRAREDGRRECTRLLTLAEQHALAARIKAGDQVAREALIMANYRLVVNIARRYYSYGASLDDLIQEGCRGLIRAVDRYDPETHNTRFSTYATYWIRNMIQRAISVNFSLIRLPDYMFRVHVRAHRSGEDPQTRDRAAKDDSESTAECSRLEISRRQRQPLTQSTIPEFSDYRLDDHGEKTSLEESVAGAHRSLHDGESTATIDELRKALDQLTPVEAWLIRRRFALDDPHEDSPSGVCPEATATMATNASRSWNYTQLSRALRVSTHRVRQLEQLALEKLRSCLGGRES